MFFFLGARPAEKEEGGWWGETEMEGVPRPSVDTARDMRRSRRGTSDPESSEERKLKDQANAVRTATRNQRRALLGTLAKLLPRPSRDTVTRAGHRAVAADGRSLTLILEDAVRFVREIRRTERTGPGVPRPLMLDDAGLRSVLLSSRSMAVFLVEMPGFTIRELSPGAQELLGHSPWGDCRGQALTNGLVHADDVQVLQGLLQCGAGQAQAATVRLLNGILYPALVRPQLVDTEHCDDELFSSHGPLHHTDDLWSEEMPGWHSDSDLNFFHEPYAGDRMLDHHTGSAPSADDSTTRSSSSQWPPDAGAVPAPLVASPMLGAGTAPASGGLASKSINLPVGAVPAPTIPGFRWLSTQMQVLALDPTRTRAEDRNKKLAFLMVPMDSVEPYLDACPNSPPAGCDPQCQSCAQQSCAQQAVLRSAGKGQQEGEIVDENLADKMERANGIYKFNWAVSVTNDITPGDVRQFFLDQICAVVQSRSSGALCSDFLSAFTGGVPLVVANVIRSVVRTLFRDSSGNGAQDWALKPIANRVIQHAEFNWAGDADGAGCPALSLHARLTLFGGTLRTPWICLLRQKINGACCTCVFPSAQVWRERERERERECTQFRA